MTTNEKINEFTDFLKDHTDPIGEQQKMIKEEEFQRLAKFLDEKQKELLDLIVLDSKYITNIEWEDIDYSDYPDFCDAHIVAANYYDDPMSEELLEKLNYDSDLLYELLMNHLY